MEPKKVSVNRQKKEQIVAKLVDKLTKAKGLVFANYQGLTHKQLENLKRKVKAANADLVVTKNTLLKRSLEISNFKFQISNFKLPTATLFLYSDPIEPLKQLAKTIKEFSLPTVKLGIIEGKKLTSDEVLKLATLPSRDVLIAQLLYQMKAPIYRLHRTLSWDTQRLVLTLKAVEKTKA